MAYRISLYKIKTWNAILRGCVFVNVIIRGVTTVDLVLLPGAHDEFSFKIGLLNVIDLFYQI